VIKIVLLLVTFCGTLFLISASPVRGQTVLWVSATGSDANACSQAAPCATFQGAINKGNASQINCLTSGNYGPVTITASITIDCGTGNIGNIVSNSGAVTINTVSAATVVLRHLNLNGQGSAAVGVSNGPSFSGTLTIDHCTIQGFLLDGISFAPAGARGLLQVSDSQIFKNSVGILASAQPTQIISVVLNRVELSGNGNFGLFLTGSGIVAGTMRDSVVGGNGSTGVLAQSGQVFFSVEESSIVANLDRGIQTNSAGSVLNVGASTIGSNGKGVEATSGSIISFGNNQMSANGSNGNFTTTTALQ
jgi:hypothetical protein